MADFTFDAAVDYLDAHIGRGVKPGLERTIGALELLADPHASYPIVHIAGTNGKTSTARMVAALLSAHGLTPGLFTSPHLDSIEQRYEVGGFAMTRTEFAAALAEIASIVDLYEERSGDPLTYFELTTVLAFAWFAERAVDVAVVETGLGGRLDATNAARSDVAVLTSIGVEHTQYLGETVEEIAGEKLAILDDGAALVTGPLDDSVLALAADRVRDADAAWHRYGDDLRADDVQRAVSGWLFDLEGVHERYDEIDLRVRGRHQVHNFVTAVGAVEALFGRSLDTAAVREAAATVRLPGRMDLMLSDPPLLVDGAHNPDAMLTLAAALREEFPTTRWTLVFGAMADKDVTSMVAALDGLVERAHVAAADSPRAVPADELADIATKVLGIEAVAFDSVGDATAQAVLSEAPVLVTGSIYVAGEARARLGT